MIRTKGEAGTGDIVNAVTHMRSVFGAHPQARRAPRGGALLRGERAARALRLRPLGRRERPSCRSSRSPREGSPLSLMPRSACSSAPTASSSAPESSSPPTHRRARRRSSRRPRTSAIPRSSRASRSGLGDAISGTRRSRGIPARRAARNSRLVVALGGQHAGPADVSRARRGSFAGPRQEEHRSTLLSAASTAEARRTVRKADELGRGGAVAPPWLWTCSPEAS